jgi:hypothetical protein
MPERQNKKHAEYLPLISKMFYDSHGILKAVDKGSTGVLCFIHDSSNNFQDNQGKRYSL